MKAKRKASRAKHFDLSYQLKLISQILILIIADLAESSTANPKLSRPKRWIQATENPPDFLEPIGNQTIAVGRDAQLSCKTKNLANFKTAWLRVEDRGIMSIHDHIITRDYRVGLRNDDGNFVLTIKNVQLSDKGGYMCQINSVPMRSAVGYLDVLMPPAFEANETATDNAGQTTGGAVVTATEGSTASLSCRAKGHPMPSISWRREDNEPIQLNGLDSASPNESGESLVFSQVGRINAGAYLCIASNGVQPAASKRQVLNVQFAPIIRISQTEVGAYLQEQGQSNSRANPSSIARLECHIELNPGGSYYWVKMPGGGGTQAESVDDLTLIESDQLSNSDKYEIVIKQVDGERVEMILDIKQPNRQDLAWYKCIARNPLGLQSASIRLYEVSASSFPLNVLLKGIGLNDGAQSSEGAGSTGSKTSGRAQTIRSNANNYRSPSGSVSYGRQASNTPTSFDLTVPSGSMPSNRVVANLSPVSLGLLLLVSALIASQASIDGSLKLR